MDLGQRRVRSLADNGDEFHQTYSMKFGNDRGILNLHPRRNFRIGQHGEIAERVFKKAAERQPQLRRAQNDRLMAAGKHLLHKFRKRIHDVPRQLRFDDQRDFATAIAARLAQVAVPDADQS